MTKYIFKNNIELQNNVLLSYKNEKDLNILSKKYNIRKKNIAEFLKSKNVFIKGQYAGSRKHAINKYYFDVIDCEEKAYFLGLLYADGSNRLNRGEVSLTLQNEDLYLLERLNEIMNPTRPVFTIKNSSNNKINRMYINSKYISNRLNMLGVFENKSFKIIYPNFLEPELYRHFIRGYFDGDGCISVNNNGKAQIQIIGTESFLSSIMKIFNNKCNTNFVKLGLNHKNIKNNIRTLSYTGNNNAIKIYHYLYDDTQIFMIRKKNKFELIQGLK